MSVEPRRFPPPWQVDEGTESFIIKDANGHALAYFYHEDGHGEAIGQCRCRE
jgi:hypothetical protein